MNTPKLKNIILIILLLLNVTLLVMLMADKAEDRRSRDSAMSALRQTLAERGISLSERVDMDAATPVGCTVRRSMDDELRLMQKLIGAQSAEDLGGNIYFYRGKDGQASLRGTGETDILFSGEGDHAAFDLQKALKKLFSKADWEIELGEDSEGQSVVYCTWNGFTVYNARLTVDVDGGIVRMISGIRVFDEATENRDGSGSMDCPTVLMRFTGIIEEEGYVCRRIDNVSAGYIMSVTMPGESSLRPVWRIDTDTGTVYINAVSGEIENPG